MNTYIVLECNKYGNNILNKVSQVMTRLSLWRRENGEQGRKRKEVAETSGGSPVWCIHDTNADFILQGKSYIMGQAIE